MFFPLLVSLVCLIFTSNPVNSQNLITIPIDGFANASFECINHLITKQMGGSYTRIDDFTADIPIKLIEGKYIFRRNLLSGLDKIQLEKLTAGLYRVAKEPQISLDFSVMIPLNFKSQYNFNCRVADIADLKGSGDLDVALGIRFYGKIVMSLYLKKDRLKLEELLVFPQFVPDIKITGLSVGEHKSVLVGKQITAVVDAFTNVEEIRIFFKELLTPIKSLVNLILRPKLSESMKMLFDIRDKLNDECPGIPQIKNVENLLYSVHNEL